MIDDADRPPSGGLNPEHNPAVFGGLNPSGNAVCGRCARIIAYDPTRSWWLDETGIPSCAPGPNGEFLEHEPKNSPRIEAMLVEPEPDPLDVYLHWPTESEQGDEGEPAGSPS